MGGDKKKRENKCCTPLRRIGWGVNYRALKVPVSRPNGVVVIHQYDLPPHTFFIFPPKKNTQNPFDSSSFSSRYNAIDSFIEFFFFSSRCCIDRPELFATALHLIIYNHQETRILYVDFLVAVIHARI